MVSRPGFELEPHGMVWDNAKYDSVSGAGVAFALAWRAIRSRAIVTLRAFGTFQRCVSPGWR